jgi:predicted RNA binding protein YcfA (HicA-like mRNA interferase family)
MSPKLPRLTAAEAEKLLEVAGFSWVRSQGSHRIYQRDAERCVIPYHAGRNLHPKIVKQVLQAIAED